MKAWRFNFYALFRPRLLAMPSYLEGYYSMTGEIETVRRRSWLRVFFGLFAVLLTLAIFGALIAWLLIPQKSVATAIFRVSRERPSILEEDFAHRYDEREYEVFKKSQLAMLRSYFMLEAAVRKPGISSLATFGGDVDPKKWLDENLETEYLQDGEYLAISLKGSESQMDDFTLIVDAVAKAYADEMVYNERARRSAFKDLLSRSLEDINKKIADKSSLMLEIAKDSGRHDEATAAALRQLCLDRLERVELELMRLENDQLSLEGGGDENSKSYETRIAQLRERQAGLEKELTQVNEPSVELDALKAEIGLLQHLANEIAIKLQKLEIDANAGPRIEQVQSAMVESD
jgi:hypothetical protein